VASNSIEQALHTYLRASTAIHDLVGHRIFFAEAEESSVRPYVTYNVVSDPHASFAFGSADSGQARVQFNVFHTDRYSALTVAHAIRKRLRHYSGSMDGITVHKLTVTGTVLLRENDKDVFMATFDALPVYIDAS
jgi:hypothetical protein